MTANDLLKKQVGGLYSVTTTKTIRECVSEMISKHVGALVVLDVKGSLSGIISERDILKLIDVDKCEFTKILVKDVMTPKEKLITAQKLDPIDSVMEKMNNNSIRHIVILDGEKFLGLGSIRDVIRMVLESALLENKQLMDYVHQSS